MLSPGQNLCYQLNFRFHRILSRTVYSIHVILLILSIYSLHPPKPILYAIQLNVNHNMTMCVFMCRVSTNWLYYQVQQWLLLIWKSVQQQISIAAIRRLTPFCINTFISNGKLPTANGMSSSTPSTGATNYAKQEQMSVANILIEIGRIEWVLGTFGMSGDRENYFAFRKLNWMSTFRFIWMNLCVWLLRPNGSWTDWCHDENCCS